MMSSDDRAVIENAFGYYPDDVSPLSQAILCDDVAKADRLLAQGASPNQREPGGLTPVLIAAALSRDALLARLLQAQVIGLRCFTERAIEPAHFVELAEDMGALLATYRTP